MKFCKNMLKVVELSDPEWSPFWVNYKFLKKKLNGIVEAEGTNTNAASSADSAEASEQKATTEENEGPISKPENLMKSAREVEFFRLVHSELKKTSEFFARTENLFVIRLQNIEGAVAMLKASKGVTSGGSDGETKTAQPVTPHAWGRLLVAVSRYYKEVSSVFSSLHKDCRLIDLY